MKKVDIDSSDKTTVSVKSAKATKSHEKLQKFKKFQAPPPTDAEAAANDVDYPMNTFYKSTII